MNAPTCQEIFEGQDDTYVEVHSEADPSWRHGCYMTDVFRRVSDDTFWCVTYTRSGDGEENGFREGDADVTQVEPYTKTVTEYRAVKR